MILYTKSIFFFIQQQKGDRIYTEFVYTHFLCLMDSIKKKYIKESEKGMIAE